MDLTAQQMADKIQSNTDEIPAQQTTDAAGFPEYRNSMYLAFCKGLLWGMFDNAADIKRTWHLESSDSLTDMTVKTDSALTILGKQDVTVTGNRTVNVGADETLNVTGSGTVNVGGGLTIVVGGDATITAAACTINADLTVNGKITASGNVKSGGNITATGEVEDADGAHTMSAMRGTFDGHTHDETGTGGGTTTPPAAPM